MEGSSQPSPLAIIVPAFAPILSRPAPAFALFFGHFDIVRAWGSDSHGGHVGTDTSSTIRRAMGMAYGPMPRNLQLAIRHESALIPTPARMAL